MITLTSQLFSFELKIKECSFNTIVIENKKVFRAFINSISNQISGEDGAVIISKDYTPIEFCGNVELVINPFCLDCNSKKTQTKITTEIKKIVHNSIYEERFNNITVELNNVASDLIQEISLPSINNNEIELTNIIKLLSYYIEPKEDFLSEIIDFCNTKIIAEGIKLFVFVNLKTYLAKNEFEVLLNQFLYDKIPAIFVESQIKSEELTSLEKLYIIDTELCEIYSE